MGDSVNIKCVYSLGSPIYFYTHWAGPRIKSVLKDALIRGRARWGDESYLARIIFSELIKGNVLGETGYGIAPYEQVGSENATVVVDLDLRTVNDVPFEEFIKQKEEICERTK